MKWYVFVVLIVVPPFVTSCSMLSTHDQKIITENSLSEMTANSVDDFYVGALPACNRVKIGNVVARLHSSYNMWEESRWSDADKNQLLTKYQSTFEELITKYLVKYDFEVTDNNPCITLKLELYDIAFGLGDKEGKVDNYKRENSGLELPLYSAKLRAMVIDPVSNEVYALILDNRKTNFPNVVPYKFEVDPSKAIEFLDDWASRVVELISTGEKEI